MRLYRAPSAKAMIVVEQGPGERKKRLSERNPGVPLCPVENVFQDRVRTAPPGAGRNHSDSLPTVNPVQEFVTLHQDKGMITLNRAGES